MGIMNMSQITKDGDCVTLKPNVNIVAENRDSLRDELRKVYEEGANRIIIDLELVESIDSIGLGLFASVHNSLRKRGAKLELINAGEIIWDMFLSLQLDQHFIISNAAK